MEEDTEGTRDEGSEPDMRQHTAASATSSSEGGGGRAKRRRRSLRQAAGFSKAVMGSASAQRDSPVSCEELEALKSSIGEGAIPAPLLALGDDGVAPEGYKGVIWPPKIIKARLSLGKVPRGRRVERKGFDELDPRDKAALKLAQSEAKERGLEIRKSLIANAGYGVFTRNSGIQAGTVLATYGGLWYSRKACTGTIAPDNPGPEYGSWPKERIVHLRGVRGPKGVSIFVYGCRTSLCTYFNAPVRGTAPNCEMSRIEGTLVLVIRTIRDVAAGEELFFEYGDQYWAPKEEATGPLMAWCQKQQRTAALSVDPSRHAGPTEVCSKQRSARQAAGMRGTEVRPVRRKRGHKEIVKHKRRPDTTNPLSREGAGT